MRATAIERGRTGRTSRSDPERWEAVSSRDAAADEDFVYSVRTTGVYCRPSCPARRPRREHVRFHGTCAEAEQAGFRPCKRCRPNEPSLAERHASAVAEACRRIEAAHELPGLDVLAAAAGMSRFHFHRVFKAVTGLTPKAYAAAHRGERARHELGRQATVTDALYGAGFGSSGRFYAASARMLGMRPSEFRAGGAGTSIRFAIGECSLGAILVAATDKGICAILLGRDPGELARELQDRFPKATLIGGEAEFEQWVARVVGLVEAPAIGLDLPLDVRGTAFQRRVWQALTEIPPGSTASYAAIAKRIGAPNAVRAVAQACAANPVAVAIPCHRVVRVDGSLSGYRWGVERKRALLEREAGLAGMRPGARHTEKKPGDRAPYPTPGDPSCYRAGRHSTEGIDHMARPGPQTQAKRLREQVKREKRKAKEDKKAVRKAAKEGGVQPDPSEVQPG